jgi:signal transduction histidine kinase
MSVPTRIDFAQEVRAERLSLLWKVTLGLSVVVIWVTLILTALSVTNLADLLFPVGAVAVGCFLCREFLRRHQFQPAVWAYIAGLFVTFALMMYTPAGVDPKTTGKDLIPFMFCLLIFIVGLLLPSRMTLLVFAISVAITLLVPAIGRPFEVSRTQLFAIGIMALSVGIAMQMSGELYGIADWALANYRKERDVASRLYDSQQEINRSFLRQKALSEKLEEANKEAEQARASALEAKNFRGQFLANMSHELRTPLNAIIGFSDAMLNFPMLYQNQTLQPAYKQDLEQINTSGKHLLSLINDILDLSKVDAGKLDLEIESVNVDELIKGVIATAAGLKGDKPIKIRRDTPETIPPVRGDTLRIRQIMLNILSNATKFTDEGTVTVGCKPQDDGTLLFWIQDTGIGIPPQDMDKIFEEFRQGTSGRRKGRAGSGLGLAISRQLLGLMGGKIWAESTLGKGSTFYFTLHLYTETPAETAAEAQPAQQA